MGKMSVDTPLAGLPKRDEKGTIRLPLISYRMVLFSVLSIIFYVSSGQITPWYQMRDSYMVDPHSAPAFGGQEVPAGESEWTDRLLATLAADSSFNGSPLVVSESLVNLGFIYLRRDEPDGALIWFNRAYMIDSSNMSVYLGFGGVCIVRGDFAGGEAWYRHGLHRDSSHFGLLYALGRSFMGQYLLYHQGCVADTLNHAGSHAVSFLDSALVYLLRAHNQRPDHAGLLYLISSVYYCRGDCISARKFHGKCGDACRGIAPVYYRKELRKCCRKISISSLFKTDRKRIN